MTKRTLAPLPLFLAVLTGCSAQTFDVGAFSGGDGGDSGSAADGGDASVLAPIDPIAAGYSWTYDVTVAGTYPNCKNGSSTGSVGQHSTIDGKDAFLISSFCSGIQSLWYSAEGDRVYVYDGTNWLTALDTPVEDGHTWVDGTQTLVWKKVGSMTITAGTFSDCWEVDAQNAAPYYAVTFCRGAGPVKWHYRDTTSQNGYDATLTAKSF